MIDETVHSLIDARCTNRLASVASSHLADAQAAYAAQDAVASAFGWFDGVPGRHWKSGGPSREAALTHAPLPPAGVWTSPAQAGDWPFHLRGIEAEIALRLGREVSPELAMSLDLAEAAGLIDSMCVSIEIVDSRWEDGLNAPAFAKLADQQLHGALVLGTWVPFVSRDWAAQVARVQVGAQAPVECQGTHSLADPAFLLPAWLRHATRQGHSLPAGTVVTTGTWVGVLHAAAGDLVTAEFPGIGSASVQL
jgi:2-keto-4-pentenoate hydratase/2-oxohepta-3-ene-1,7-dioic acid hydratase in catechol pathway